MSAIAHDAYASGQTPARRRPTGLALMTYRVKKGLLSPTPYLMVFGIGLWLFTYWLLCEGLSLPRFEKIPGPITILSDWLSADPKQGTSIYTPEYYQHIWVSSGASRSRSCSRPRSACRSGCSSAGRKIFREYVFPVFETLRPIPILAWVPLAILMFSGYETPVIFLTFLASFFATALNTMLGVESIDESYSRAAGLPRREQVAGLPGGDRARRDAVHLHRAADLGRRRLVLAGRRRDGVGRVRPRLRDQLPPTRWCAIRRS